MKLISDIYTHRDLLLIMTVRNIKIRYKNSVLGFFWTLLSPLFLIIIYNIFLKIMRFTSNLPLLVVGIVVWQYLAMCLGDSLHTVIGNTNLIKKSAFPRIILPLAMTLANLVNLLLSLTVVFVYLIAVHSVFGSVVWLPLILLTHFALCLGVGLIVSSVNVYFRDTEHILTIAMLAWFFLTPVIYPISLMTEKFGSAVQHLFFLNPMTGIITAYRSVLLSEPIPGGSMILVSFAVAWTIPLVGVAIFQKLQVKFADIL
jgi:lipopolysaccharide transport system permease protein